MSKLYINVEDKQGGAWALGEVGTLRAWRDYAMNWADSDENYGTYEALKRYTIKNSDLLDYINDFWDIEIIPFDKDNAEHLELQRKRGEF